MTDPIIHQMYCTHCTYGTSAQHRHQGNIKDQPFEYSTRSGSIERSKSHEAFQKFEKLYFRGLPLPSDTPTDARQLLRGTTSPWRRLVAAGNAGGSFLANVVYRTTDTSKPPRTGCYFAHVLTHSPSAPNERGWSLADALKMWAAEFWVLEDRDELPHDLLKISELPKRTEGKGGSLTSEEATPLRQLPGFGSVVNDKALLSFLTTPPGGSFQDGRPASTRDDVCPANAIPQRWRNMSIESRVQFFTALFQSILNLNLERRERLTLAIEPSLAALLFYGVIRLLPRSGLVDQLSVSTFEPHTEASSTVLTATDFFNPVTTDLIPGSQRNGLAINTYSNRPLPTTPAFPYVTTMMQKLLTSNLGPAAVDAFHEELSQAGFDSRSKIRDYDQFLGVEDLVERLLQPSSSNPVTERELSLLSFPAARQKLRKLVSSRLRDLPFNSSLWTELRGTPSRALMLIRLLTEDAGFVDAAPILSRLCDCVPTADLPAFFDDSRIPSEQLLRRLQREITATGELPAGCDSLWASSRTADGHPVSLLDQLFATQEISSLRTFCESILDTAATAGNIASPRVQQMLSHLAKASKALTNRRDLLTRCLENERFNDDSWDTLLRNSELRSQVMACYPSDEHFLRKRLVAILTTLPNSGRKFLPRLEILNAAESHLPTENRQEMATWRRVGTHLRNLSAIESTPDNLLDRYVFKRRSRDLNELGRQLGTELTRILRDNYGIRSSLDQKLTVKSLATCATKSGEISDAFTSGLNLAFAPATSPNTAKQIHNNSRLTRFLSVVWTMPIALSFLLASTCLAIYLFALPSPNADLPRERANTPTKIEVATAAANVQNSSATTTQTRPVISAQTTPEITSANTAPAGNQSKSPKAVVEAHNTLPITTVTTPAGNGKLRSDEEISIPIEVVRNWKPQKLYHAAIDHGSPYNIETVSWDCQDKISFLTFHGECQQRGQPLDQCHQDAWPLFVEWTASTSMTISAASPATNAEPSADPPLPVWVITATETNIKRTLNDKSLQKLSRVSERLQNSWDRCILGVHCRDDLHQFFTLGNRHITQLGPLLRIKNSLTFSFAKPIFSSLPSRCMAINGAASLYTKADTSTEQILICDGASDALYSGKWSVGKSWPKNSVATEATVTVDSSNLKISLKGGNSLVKLDNDYKAQKIPEPSLEDTNALVHTQLHASMKNVLELIKTSKNLAVVDRTSPLNVRLNLEVQYKHCKALCDYWHKDIALLPPTPRQDDMNSDTFEKTLVDWCATANIQVSKLRSILSEQLPPGLLEKQVDVNDCDEVASLRKLKLILTNPKISCDIYDVVECGLENLQGNSSQESPESGRVVRGIAVLIAQYGESKK